ncbi:hypothetical protein [Sphaerospermopsis aphanizomenoides]|nr:hypothetical protein [Sphaerospermopsis aphanizomenoides]
MLWVQECHFLEVQEEQIRSTMEYKSQLLLFIASGCAVSAVAAN